MKKLQCNICVGKTQVEIDREPNNIYDVFLCTECDVTLAYVPFTPYTKKLMWLPNIEFEKQVGICIATIIEWE
jgi:hypothetical protein